MAIRGLIPFLVGMMLLTGVANTLLTKYQDKQCVADCDTDHPRLFEQPVLQSLQMFIGESGCGILVLIGHLVQRLRSSGSQSDYEPIPTHESEEHENGEHVPEDGHGEDGPGLLSSSTLVDTTNAVTKPLIDGEQVTVTRVPLKGWKVIAFAIPAICDICGTTLMNVGLLLVAASIYQMTRGALVLFVGFASVIFLHRHLSGWKWISLLIVVSGVAVVGLAGALDQKLAIDLPGDAEPDQSNHLLYRVALAIRDGLNITEAHTPAETVAGVGLIAGAQIFTAFQFVLEEKIMEKYSVGPLEAVGWEGVFGFIVTLLGMGIGHAVYGRTPAGQGGYWDAGEGFYQMFNNRTIGLTSLAIMLSIGGFNYFGLSVTRSVSATSRSTIDTFRTLFIWAASLGFGWETFKWLQVVGFAMLVYGTALFNDIISAPAFTALRRHLRGPPSPHE